MTVIEHVEQLPEVFQPSLKSHLDSISEYEKKGDISPKRAGEMRDEILEQIEEFRSII